ncbi:hypothetical protein PYCCODRAFT_1417417 [Trametes coccinea BRFM310]|uniref:CxC5 like cysteine cluster associated with KDZ domain-containing protein n=1 Tax=Trametes coccinea (strain BRFM310) TaxID=1353009 RepID=A0A1Y2ICD2_TRAC3|nr:hypothetical protein PYCCODRAFT_1417417 [Trametes coccinea BRFM310]
MVHPESSTSARLACILFSLPELTEYLTLEDLNRFCDLVRWLRPEITAVQRSHIHTAPPHLPANIHNFFMQVFSMPDEVTKIAWYALREIAWDMGDTDSREIERRVQAMVSAFLCYGLPNDIAFYNLWPPTRSCNDPACQRALPGGETIPRELVEPYIYTATVFSRDIGAIPARVISLYCRNCKTRYYPSYYVHDGASLQTYYPGVPHLIHLSKRTFISGEVCEMFANLMMTSWASATNCARFYNLSLTKPEISVELPSEWNAPFELDTEHVWESFFLYSLLLDHNERGTMLCLPHQEASQADRLLPALNARNILMAGAGQEHWSHCCDLCTARTVDESGQDCGLRSAVTDGVGIGHPCCAVHDCKEPLLTKPKGARYCKLHADLEYHCSVIACEMRADEGFKTCGLPSHRALDNYLNLQNKAMFQLRSRLERLTTSQTSHNLVPTVATLDSLDVACEVKSPQGNKRIRAQFGRRRTHNEETCVASCGVILGRATMFGSEAVSGVLEFWKRLFPTSASLPGVLWHDQNCRLWSMLQNEDEQTRNFFQNIALPVDVFHFKCKHKETDVVCGTHCNPYIWPELRTSDGKWRFNSSAAEQSNVWFGKFQAMVREMHVDRYNFFLDEMVKRRNRMRVKELEKKGYRPFLVPREAWLT